METPSSEGTVSDLVPAPGPAGSTHEVLATRSAREVNPSRRASQVIFQAILGLTFTGSLGVLLLAKKTGLLNAVMPVVERMELSGFRISAVALKEFKKLAGEPCKVIRHDVRLALPGPTRNLPLRA